MTTLLEELLELYALDDASASGTLRLTDRGIWHATPIAVLAAVVPLIGERGLLAPRRRPLSLLDAGAGDGRLLAALALGLPSGLDVRLYGIECDRALVDLSRDKLRALAGQGPAPDRKVGVAHGDFFELRTYAALDLAPSELDLVFNYPDGSERRLLRWLAAHGGRETRLVILSPDRDPALGQPPEWREQVRPEGDSAAPWSLTVFAPSQTGQ